MIQQILHENWRMRCAEEEEYRPAAVPGTVYTDLLRSGAMEDPFWKDNEVRTLPLSEKDYEYETSFDLKEEFALQDKIRQGLCQKRGSSKQGGKLYSLG